jgi:hypothetical protein
LAEPYPAELIRVAQKVVGYDAPKRRLLPHLTVYNAPAEVQLPEAGGFGGTQGV